MLHQIKAQHFDTDFGLYQQCKVLQKIVEFKHFSRLLSDFPVLFKAVLIFKDFSRKLYKFKYFSSLCEPCYAQSPNVSSLSEKSVPHHYPCEISVTNTDKQHEAGCYCEITHA